MDGEFVKNVLNVLPIYPVKTQFAKTGLSRQTTTHLIDELVISVENILQSEASNFEYDSQALRERNRQKFHAKLINILMLHKSHFKTSQMPIVY